MLCSIFISYFLSVINLTLTLICIHTELPDRSGAALLLPLSKDSRTKEENHKLLNGNSGDPTDWVLINGVFYLVFHISHCFFCSSLSFSLVLTLFTAVFVQRLRTQVNGKLQEDGNTVHVDTAMNGV